MSSKTLSRREFLSAAGLAALGAATACTSKSAANTPVPPTATVMSTNTPVPPTATVISTNIPVPPTATVISAITSAPPQSTGAKNRVLRIAHLTDIHVLPDKVATDGMARAIRHAQNQADPPDFIVNTGDCIMESLEATKADTEKQWDTFNGIIKAEVKLPIYHVIGNHDVWGWARDDAEVKNDPLYGKAMAVKQLGLSNRYYSFDKGGWHFVALDSTHLPNAVSEYPYIGQLDIEQFIWLGNDLAAVNPQTPVCILSHIPILCACEFFDGENENSGNWVVPAAWMHIDARTFRTLFLKQKNVKLCLSGHAHMYDDVKHLNVHYLCDGAVCGAWWSGAYLDFPPAYVMVNLYDDGTADSEFVVYT